MKINTKKCSPVSLRRTSMPNVSGVGLDERDLVLKNPNKYIPDDEQDKDNKDDDDKCGRKVEYIAQLIYSPVKVSARTNKRNGHGGSTSRTVTDQEMNDLNACLLNLRFGDENQDSNAIQKHTNEVDSIEKKPLLGKTQQKHVDAVQKHANKADSIEKKPILGRVQQKHVDPQSGKRTIVLKSSRIGKKIVRL